MSKIAEKKQTEETRGDAAAQLEVLSLILQQLEIVSMGVGVTPAVKLEAARQHVKFSRRRQKMLLALGR